MDAIEKYDDKTPMPFGAHRGIALANVKASYLIWLWDSSEQGKRLSDAKLARYISENIQALRLEIESEKQKRYYERR